MDTRAYSKWTAKRGWSWETEPPAISDDALKETIDADVIIIGGGISGLAAAARLSQKGLHTLIIDKHERLSAFAGQVAALDSPVMREHGMVIDKKQFARDWMAVSGSRVNEDILWLFINRSAEAFEWFMSLAEDCLDIKLYKGYKGPGFEEYPGTHQINKKPDCVKYKNNGGGMLICEILEAEFTKNGGRIHRNVRAEQLEKDSDGRIVSVIAKTKDGYTRYKGSKAVILATGDISGNQEMLKLFSPIALRPEQNPFDPAGLKTGDGHKMAYWAGAAFDDPSWATSLHLTAYCPYAFFFLHVNQRGRRFMNEDTWMQAKAIRCLMQPGGDYAYTIMDAKWLRELGERSQLIGGQGNLPLNVSHYGDEWDDNCGIVEEIEDAISRGMGAKAGSIEALAESIGLPPLELAKTVERYNELYRLGQDCDFGKRHELLTTITDAPFYAIKWGPGLLNVFGGVLTDTKLRVLMPDKEPIPGLFAVGNIAGGMYGVDYPLLLNGNSYGRALTWGLAVTDAIAEELH